MKSFGLSKRFSYKVRNNFQSRIDQKGIQPYHLSRFYTLFKRVVNMTKCK